MRYTNKNRQKPFIIAIDGPAGAGKTGTARRVAGMLDGFAYLDTGAVYRAMAYALAAEGFSAGDVASARGACLDVIYRDDIRIRRDANGAQVMCLAGEPVSDPLLRTPEISGMSSEISADPVMRMFARYIINGMEPPERGIVAEGRDTGTALFPEAALKFYLYAPAQERARRRLFQRGKPATPKTMAEALAELSERDERDISRSADPLRCADGAIWIDTGALDEDAVVALVMGIAKGRMDPDSVPLA